MNYEINVSLNGVHLFATHERSLTSRRAADTLYTLFCQKFPLCDGYVVTMSERSNSSRYLATNSAVQAKSLGCKHAERA